MKSSLVYSGSVWFQWLAYFKVLALTFMVTESSSFAASEAETTLTKVGQMAPNFTLSTVDGKEFNLQSNRGKVVLVNFFATWCGPCLEELPHVEKEIWQRFQRQGLVVISIGREHQNSEVAEFRKKNNYTFLMAGDPKRKVYGKFATEYIPRTYLVNKEGQIVYQSMGFADEEFKKLVAAIEKECVKGSSK